MRPTFPACSLVLFALAGCATTAPADPTITPLLDTIERRLELADIVALHKWDLGQPVQASERERQVIAAVRLAAADHDLAPDRAEDFFVDQMEASKLVQYTLLSRWHALGEAPALERQDLRQVLRPRLDRLQHQLLDELARFDQQSWPQCQERLAAALAERSDDMLRQVALARATGRLCQAHLAENAPK